MTDLDALRLKWPTVSPDIKRIMVEGLKACLQKENSKTGCVPTSATVTTTTT